MATQRSGALNDAGRNEAGDGCKPSECNVSTKASPQRQFSLRRLLFATATIALLFAWLGALPSTTRLNLVLCSLLAVVYLFGELWLRMPGSDTAIHDRVAYFVVQAAILHAISFVTCFVSFTWQRPTPTPLPSVPQLWKKSVKRSALQPFPWQSPTILAS